MSTAKIVLNWTINTELKYIFSIYKSETYFSLLDIKDYEPIAVLTQTNYIDYDVIENKIYYYRISYKLKDTSEIVSNIIEIQASVDKDLKTDYVSSFLLTTENNELENTVSYIGKNSINNNHVLHYPNKQPLCPRSPFGKDRNNLFYFNGTSASSNNSASGRFLITNTVLNASNFCYETWISPHKNIMSGAHIVQISSALNNGIRIRFDGTSYPFKICLDIYDSGWKNLIIANTLVYVFDWTHVCIQRIGGIFYLYINGILQGINESYKTQNILGNIKISNNNSNTSSYCGLFHSSRLTLSQRYPFEDFDVPQYIGESLNDDPLYNSVDFLVKIDDTGSPKDYSKNNKAITVVGTDINRLPILPESFDGHDAFYHYGDGRLIFSGTNHVTKDFTIEMYIKPNKDKSETNARLLCIGPLSQNDAAVLYYSGAASAKKISFAIYTSGAYIYPVMSNSSLIENKFYHVCLMRKKGIFYLYINGILESSNANYKNIKINCSTYNIGANTSNTDKYIGYIAGFRVTDYARYPENSFNINYENGQFIKPMNVIKNLTTKNYNNIAIKVDWELEDENANFGIFKDDKYFNRKTKNITPIISEHNQKSFIDSDIVFNKEYYYGVAQKLDNVGYYKLDTVKGVLTESDIMYDKVILNIDLDHGTTDIYSNENGNNISFINNNIVVHKPYFNNDSKFILNPKKVLSSTFKNAIGINNFTLELILSIDIERTNSVGHIPFILGNTSAVIGAGITLVHISDSTYAFRTHNGSSFVDLFTFQLESKKYNAITLERNNSVLYLYIDGNRIGMNDSIGPLDLYTNTLYIGGNESDANLTHMCISRIRLTHETCRYLYSLYEIDKNDIFIEDEHASSVTFYLDCEQDIIKDSSQDKNKINYDINSTKIIDIGENVSALYLDGISYMESPAISMGTDNFTIEMDVIGLLNDTSFRAFLSLGAPSQNGALKMLRHQEFILTEIYNSYWTRILGIHGLEKANIALVRQDGIFYMYINGKLIGINDEHKTLALLPGLFIGRTDGSTTDIYSGYISNLRITMAPRYIGNSYNLPKRPYYKYKGLLVDNLQLVNKETSVEIISKYKGLAKEAELYRSIEPMINGYEGELIHKFTNLQNENIYIDNNVEQDKLYYYMIKYYDGLEEYKSNPSLIGTFDIIEWNPSFSKFNTIWINNSSVDQSQNELLSLTNAYKNNSTISFEKGSLGPYFDNSIVFNTNSSMKITQDELIYADNKNGIISFAVLDLYNDGIIFTYTNTLIDIKLVKSGNSIEIKTNNSISARYNLNSLGLIINMLINNNVIDLYINGIIINREILSDNWNLTNIQFGSDVNGFSGIIGELVHVSTNDILPEYVLDKISAYLGYKYNLLESINEHNIYKESPKSDFSILDVTINYEKYENVIRWNARDLGSTFKIYKGRTYNTIDNINPIYEGRDLIFKDNNFLDNIEYVYKIDHIYNGKLVFTEYKECNTYITGYWVVNSANWGTTQNASLNPNAITRSDWKINYENTRNFLVWQYRYEAEGNYTTTTLTGNIEKNMLGHTFEIRPYVSGANSVSQGKLFFEDEEGNLLFYMEWNRHSGGYSGFRVKYGKSTTELTNSGGTSYAFFGEFSITETQFKYISKVKTGSYLGNFTINSDFSKLYRLRVETNTKDGYTKTSSRLGLGTYFYIKCIS